MHMHACAEQGETGGAFHPYLHMAGPGAPCRCNTCASPWQLNSRPAYLGPFIGRPCYYCVLPHAMVASWMCWLWLWASTAINPQQQAHKARLPGAQSAAITPLAASTAAVLATAYVRRHAAAITNAVVCRGRLCLARTAHDHGRRRQRNPRQRQVPLPCMNHDRYLPTYADIAYCSSLQDEPSACSNGTS